MPIVACSVPAAPVYRGPHFETEMVNQLLFGETMEVLEVQADWYRIAGSIDRYQGWISRLQVTNAEEDSPILDNHWVAGDFLNSVILENSVMQVPMGSSLPGLQGSSGSFGGLTYQFTGHAYDRTKARPDQEWLWKLAMSWQHVPYRWGGRSILGVDCSGYTQVIFKMMGIDLPRDAFQQAEKGISIDFLQQARCGDLAFFDNADGHVIHVGILLNDHEIIHAAGKVRVDRIDNAGIIHTVTGLRTHQLRVIRRYF